MTTDLGEGTVSATLAPPHPWPTSSEIPIDTPFHTEDVEFAVLALPTGRFRITLAATGQPAIVLNTCPIEFTGEGLFRLAFRYKGKAPHYSAAASV